MSTSPPPRSFKCRRWPRHFAVDGAVHCAARSRLPYGPPALELASRGSSQRVQLEHAPAGASQHHRQRRPGDAEDRTSASGAGAPTGCGARASAGPWRPLAGPLGPKRREGILPTCRALQLGGAERGRDAIVAHGGRITGGETAPGALLRSRPRSRSQRDHHPAGRVPRKSCSFASGRALRALPAGGGPQ